MKYESALVVGCDLDGVIGDIVQQLVRFSRREHGILLSRKQIVSENIETCTPIRREQLHRLFENREFFRSLPLVPRARESLSKLRAAGYQIHIVTDRFWYAGIHEDTTDWLIRHRIPFDSVVFARKAEKHDIAESLNVQWFIEDQLSNARLLAPLCRVLLLDRPYNQGDVPDRVIRTDSLDESVNLITQSSQFPSGRQTQRIPARYSA